MPVDTRDKRASATNLFTPLPLPAGSVTSDDRAQVSWVYRGLVQEITPTTLRHNIAGREPARAFSGRRAPTSVSGREPARTAAGRIHGETP